jgi:hypothetical protein
VGVRAFLFDWPRATPTAQLRDLAEHVLPELREEYRAAAPA